MARRPPQLTVGGFEPARDAPSFKVTDSGTFSKDSWQVKGTGIHHTPAGQGRISDLNLSDLKVCQPTHIDFLDDFSFLFSLCPES